MEQGTDQPRRIEEQLRSQNLFMKDALDALAYPFCVVNADSYIVELANATAYSGELHDDFTCYKLLHGRERPCSDDKHPCPLPDIKKTKKPVVIERPHVNKEGEFQYVEIHGYPILDAAGTVTHMIEYSLDITKHKQFEKALRESETNWRSLIETSPDHILLAIVQI